MTETITTDENGNEITVINVDVKADNLDDTHIVHPDTPDTPAVPTDTDTDTETETETEVYGDINYDGKVTAKDSMTVQICNTLKRTA